MDNILRFSDILGLMADVKGTTDLFGGRTEEFQEEYQKRLRKLGDTFAEEAFGGIDHLPEGRVDPNTRLGPNSVRQLTELKEWLAAQSPKYFGNLISKH